MNGDFSAGNTGFTTGYTYAAGDPPNQGGHYTVDTNPYNFNSGMASFPDHTTGTGQMLIVDGSLNSGVVIWQETVSVTPNTNYQWTAFGASAGQSNGNGIDPSPARLVFTANGSQVGSSFPLFSQDGLWEKFTGTFNSGASTSEVLSFTDTNTTFLGNDFAVDDISLTPEPGSISLLGIATAGLLARRRKNT